MKYWFILLLVLTACSPAASDPRLLAWREAAANPAQTSATVAGELVLIGPGGSADVVMEVPAQAKVVQPCGDSATSADGRLFAFYVGSDAGDLYVMRGTDAPQKAGRVSRLSCLDGGLRFAPGAARLVYIDYPATIPGEFAAGKMHVLDSGSLDVLFQQEHVAAFDLTDEVVAFTQFFTNTNGQANEAVINWWDGTSGQTVARLAPDRDCRYSSASLRLIDRETALLVLGHRCRNQGTRWQFYRVEQARVSLLDSAAQGGAFMPHTRTNQIYLAPDRQSAYFTVPDGVTASTTALLRLSLTDFTLQTIIAQQMVMPNLSGAANAFPRLSADGRWLTAVITSPNNENRLAVIDLAAETPAPRLIQAGQRGDVIVDMALGSDTAYYIAGKVGSHPRDTDTVLNRLDMATGTVTELARGRYALRLVLGANDGFGVMGYVVPENGQQPYLNLLHVAGEAVTVLDEGAVWVDGRITERRFALPLAWRP